MSARKARFVLFAALAALLACLGTGPCWGQHSASSLERTTGEMLRGRLAGPPGYFRRLVFSPDGKLIAAGLTQDSRLLLFEVAALKEKLRLQLPGNNDDYNLAFTADGRTLVSEAREDECLRTWDVVTGKQIREVKKDPLAGPRVRPLKKSAWTFLAFSPGGKQLAATRRDSRQGVYLCDTRTGKLLRSLPVMEDCIGGAFSADGKKLALHGLRGGVLLWDVERNRQIRRLTEGDIHRAGAFGFADFSPDGKHLATGGHIDNHLHVWDVASGKETLRLDCQGFFCSASFSPDGTLLAAASTDGVVLHDLLNGKELAQLGRAYGQFVSFSPDGSLLAIAGQTPQREACITLFDMPRKRHDPQPRQLSEKQLQIFWEELATDNTFRLQRILAGLREAPGDAVPFLAKKLQPVKDAELKRVKKLVQGLDDDDADTRDRALADLQEAGAAFEPLLMEVQRAQEPGETRNRVRVVLGRLREAPVPPTLLTHLRAVTALEQMGTPAAREVLAKLAKGASGARLTVEASQALERLQKRTARERNK